MAETQTHRDQAEQYLTWADTAYRENDGIAAASAAAAIAQAHALLSCRRCNTKGPLRHLQGPDGGAWLCDTCRPIVELEFTVEAVIDALEPLGFEGVVVCSDGSEPCASLDLGGASLDVTLQVRADA